MDIFKKVQELVADLQAVDEQEVTRNASLRDDLGADSLDLVELVMTLEETFEIEIADEDGENFKTVGDVVDFVEKTKGQR